MRVERMTSDKLKVFLTPDDLDHRGINKENIWHDIPSVHDLFSEMMDYAQREFDFDISGPMAVEIFTLPVQGLVLLITRVKGSASSDISILDELEYDDNIFDENFDICQLELCIEDKNKEHMFRFDDIEHIINVVRYIASAARLGGKVYLYNEKYYWIFKEGDVDSDKKEMLLSVLAEFGERSTISYAVLHEYGKVIIEEDAAQHLIQFFT